MFSGLEDGSADDREHEILTCICCFSLIISYYQSSSTSVKLVDCRSGSIPTPVNTVFRTHNRRYWFEIGMDSSEYSRGEDFEKRLKHLSKEEAAVLAGMKKRSELEKDS